MISLCTSITFLSNDFYVGRNLDLDCSFNEQLVIVPRHFDIPNVGSNHYAIIGMATVIDGIPLFADACNEQGLAMCGLQFEGYATYYPRSQGKVDIGSYEIISRILSNCKSVAQAKDYLKNANIINEPFRPGMPVASLHWIVADKEESITIESTKRGLEIFSNPVGVLTNNPGFEYQLQNLANYMNLTIDYANNRWNTIDLKSYANGMGALGLPGDASSVSRFVKAAFLKTNLYSDGTEKDSVQQFFRVLDQVAMIKGSVKTPQGTLDHTIYSSCMNTTRGIYYFKTYQDMTIKQFSLLDHDLETNDLIFRGIDDEKL